jgi:uncharacterized membrane protein
MAFCGKCGSPVAEGMAFCGKCGASLAPPPPGPAVPATGTGLSSNAAAALSYLLTFITGILFLVLEPHKNDRFVRFHAFQSIFFGVVTIVVWMLANSLFLFGLAGFGFLFRVWSLLYTLILLAFFLYWLFLMYKAYNREWYKIPFLGDLALKQAG